MFDVKPLGTMAHEWIMGISALEGLLHANKHAMRIWSDVYKGNLGTALTDTFGSAAFFNDFDGVLARLFDGLRHDSGDPIEFAEKAIKAYKNLGINPMTKTIIFSDGLDVDTALKIAESLNGKINFSFGIGTNLSNDFRTADDPRAVSKALNMVIKMMSCNGVDTVKISDVESKVIGEKDAVRVALWTFFKIPLDA
jgi:nicotinate phosphoribosyltransferase